MRRFGRNCLLTLLSAWAAAAQTAGDLQSIVARVERVEAENRRLSEEIADLKKELAMARDSHDSDPALAQQTTAAADERVGVLESRTAELDQKKVESSQKMPLQLTGMLLFNAFANGANGGSGLSDPTTASGTSAKRYDGATLRQTVIGLKYFGPELPGGGTVSGSVYMDFLGGSAQPGNNLFRLRIASLDLAWKNTTITVGQDKPIIAPREPASLAQVGVSPLTGTGNLWQWQPQARIEQRFSLDERSQIRVQGGVFESYEIATPVPAGLANSLEQWRPAYEGRAGYVYAGERKRLELAGGYHASDTHVAGQSVASRLISADWLIRPLSWLDFTGAWFTGRNDAGLGALHQGFTILPTGLAIPVHSDGGWGQITLTASQRWSFHLFSGEEYDRARDLAGNGISRNILYGGNVMWKLAPNVVAAFEATQLRTLYLLSGLRVNDHYDLALAYLF